MKRLIETLIGAAALVCGAVMAIVHKEKTPDELAREREAMRHDARWP